MQQQTLLRPAIDEAVDSTTNATRRFAFSVNAASKFSVHYEHTGNATSTITLLASGKRDPDATSDTDWVDTGQTFTEPAGADAKDLIEVTTSGNRWYMFKFVTASGSGTLSLWVNTTTG